MPGGQNILIDFRHLWCTHGVKVNSVWTTWLQIVDGMVFQTRLKFVRRREKWDSWKALSKCVLSSSLFLFDNLNCIFSFMANLILLNLVHTNLWSHMACIIQCTLYLALYVLIVYVFRTCDSNKIMLIYGTGYVF